MRNSIRYTEGTEHGREFTEAVKTLMRSQADSCRTASGELRPYN